MITVVTIENRPDSAEPHERFNVDSAIGGADLKRNDYKSATVDNQF
jgi:hypothetical protein